MPIVSEIIVVAIALLVFGLLLVITILRLRSKEIILFHLGLYSAMGVFLSLSLLAGLLQVTSLAANTQVFINQFGLLGLILVFGGLTLNFLRKDQKSITIYWSVTLVIVLLWSVMAFNFQGWGAATTTFLANSDIGVADQVEQLTLAVAGLGWLVALGTTLVALWMDFRKRQPTQYLNKLRYWLIATTLLSVSGLVLFVSPTLFNTAGLGLLSTGSVLIGYNVLSYHTPDVKLLIGRALFYLGVTAILAAVFVLGLATAVIISRNPRPNEFYILFWTVILAICLAVIFPPLWRFSHRLLSVVIFGKNYRDQSQVIRHYSQRISSALDLNRLGDIVINLMIETLGIEQGVVFVRERADVVGISLRPISSIGIGELSTSHFTLDSPFISYFREGHKLLSQYDVDVLPRFRGMLDSEREWLTGLGMELYVAVLLQHELVGLLAFGPQPQGTAYYEEDLELMTALADRVAPAIDNARLFEQLAVINQEVGSLTDKLAGLDQDKADFLSIASHELRTPLTHIHGYSRMLLDLTEDELVGSKLRRGQKLVKCY